LQGRSGNQAVNGATTVFMNLERFIGELLSNLEHGTTGITLIFV
jgi:hypothetical protein